MLKRTMVAVGFVLAAALAGTAVAAEPTIDQIYQAAREGQLAQADSMINAVLADHPRSAKAHYVHAEVLYREGKLGAARSELDKANALAPGLPFARPESVAELRRALEPRAGADRGSPSGSAFEAPAQVAPHGISPVAAGGFVLLVCAVLAFVFMRRRRTGPAYYGGGAPMPGTGRMYGGGYPQGGPYPQGGGAPYGVPGGGSGGGLGRALATGAAMGLGVAAAEEAVRHFSHRGDGNAWGAGNAGNERLGQGLGPSLSDLGGGNADMGGNDFGIQDASSWDDGGMGGGDWDDNR